MLHAPFFSHATFAQYLLVNHMLPLLTIKKIFVHLGIVRDFP